MDPQKPGEDVSDYLKRLANSVLDRERQPAPSGSPPASERPAFGPTPPVGARPLSIPPARSSRHSGVNTLPTDLRTPTPLASSIPHESPVAGSSAPSRRGGDVALTGPSGAFLSGVILLFEDNSIGIFRGPIKGKDYDLVYLLSSDGRLKPQGIPLQNYDVRAIGRIQPAYLDTILTSHRWTRDLIVFHLLEYEDCALIPPIVAATATPVSETRDSTSGFGSSTSVPRMRGATVGGVADPPTGALPASSDPLARGRRLSVKFGQQAWDCVFWGRDELGTVVAHKAGDRWALMHMDLKRFKDSLSIGDVLASDELRRIEADISSATR